jgi:hypothetical protein
MKKIGFFNLFIPVMVAYGSRGTVVDTQKDLRVIKATQVAQNINELDHSLILILLLLALIFAALFVLSVFFIVRRLIRIGRAYHKLITSGWIDESEAHLIKANESDLSFGMFTDQQWLLNQLFSQGHEDGDAHEFVDPPHDWWS